MSLSQLLSLPSYILFCIACNVTDPGSYHLHSDTNVKPSNAMRTCFRISCFDETYKNEYSVLNLWKAYRITRTEYGLTSNPTLSILASVSMTDNSQSKEKITSKVKTLESKENMNKSKEDERDKDKRRPDDDEDKIWVMKDPKQLHDADGFGSPMKQMPA